VVPDARLADVPGLVNFFRTLGGALGVKALSLVIDARLAVLPAGAAPGARAEAFSTAFLLLALLAVFALPLAARMHPLAPARPA
jgi:hypothetical protein